MQNTEIRERTTAQAEIGLGDRFAFGKNWSLFLDLLDEGRIRKAEASLRTMLQMETLKGKTFLDIGSGSGLFSLAARRLGAKVHSFDFDPESVACTSELRRRFFDRDPHWVVESGSVLDDGYMEALEVADIVYSWGVLHHTGAMWKALDAAGRRVAPAGLIFIAIYNDQGASSRRWLRVKQMYNVFPSYLRWLVLVPATVRLWGLSTAKDLVRGRIGASWREYESAGTRGMSPWRDVVDWVGGLPFEVARPDDLFDFFRSRGFRLQKLVTCGGGHGCNEMVFKRND